MADIIKIGGSTSQQADAAVQSIAPALIQQSIETAETTEGVSVFMGSPTLEFDGDTQTMKDIVNIYLQKYYPAEYNGNIYISPLPLVDSNVLMFSPIQVAGHTDNFTPIVFDPITYNASYPATRFVSTFPYRGELVMFGGPPLIHHQTELVYLQPTNGLLDIGNITSPTKAEITIFNSSIVSQTLVSLDLPATFGIVIIGFIPNTVIGPRQSVTYPIDITMSGALDVSGRFYINTDRGRLPFTLKVTRVALILLNMEPNSGSYSEIIEFKTNIFTSVVKKERRKPYLYTPRRKVAYTVNIYDYNWYTYAKSLALLSMYDPDIVHQLLWFRSTKLNFTVAGTTTLYCDTTGRDYKAGEKIVIQNNPRLNVNLVTILAVTPTSLEVDGPVRATTGADIVATFVGYVGKRSSGSYKDIKQHTHSYRVEEFNIG